MQLYKIKQPRSIEYIIDVRVTKERRKEGSGGREPGNDEIIKKDCDATGRRRYEALHVSHAKDD
jgi:hypothetical protein